MKKLLYLVCVFVSLPVQSQDERKIFVDSLLTGVEVKKDIRYNTLDRPLLLDIYYPQRENNELLPCVMWIHGGGLTDNSIQKNYDIVRWGIARIVKQGFINISIDYRLITERQLPTAIQDCETAIRFIKSHAGQYGIDTNRIAVVGESAGGYLAGFCSFAGNSDIFSTKEWNHHSGKIACGVLWYPAISHPPYNMIDYISPGDVPVISIHGDRDTMVPIDQSYQIRNKCQENGLDFQLHVIQGADHGFFHKRWEFEANYRKYMEEAIEITIDFLKKNL